MLARFYLALWLVLICGPAAAFTPNTASSCKSTWGDNVDTLDYFKREMENAWAMVEKQPDRAAGIFATIRNWQGHSVDFSNCVGLTSISAKDVSDMRTVSADFVDLANCGLSISDMSIANNKWHSSREPWLNQARGTNGQLLFTDADMRGIAEDILKHSQNALSIPGCQVYRYARNWANSTSNWAQGMLQNPRFAD